MSWITAGLQSIHLRIRVCHRDILTISLPSTKSTTTPSRRRKTVKSLSTWLTRSNTRRVIIRLRTRMRWSIKGKSILVRPIRRVNTILASWNTVEPHRIKIKRFSSFQRLKWLTWYPPFPSLLSLPKADFNPFGHRQRLRKSTTSSSNDLATLWTHSRGCCERDRATPES